MNDLSVTCRPFLIRLFRLKKVCNAVMLRMRDTEEKCLNIVQTQLTVFMVVCTFKLRSYIVLTGNSEEVQPTVTQMYALGVRQRSTELSNDYIKTQSQRVIDP